MSCALRTCGAVAHRSAVGARTRSCTLSSGCERRNAREGIERQQVQGMIVTLALRGQHKRMLQCDCGCQAVRALASRLHRKDGTPSSHPTPGNTHTPPHADSHTFTLIPTQTSVPHVEARTDGPTQRHDRHHEHTTSVCSSVCAMVWPSARSRLACTETRHSQLSPTTRAHTFTYTSHTIPTYTATLRRIHPHTQRYEAPTSRFTEHGTQGARMAQSIGTNTTSTSLACAPV